MFEPLIDYLYDLSEKKKINSADPINTESLPWDRCLLASFS